MALGDDDPSGPLAQRGLDPPLAGRGNVHGIKALNGKGVHVRLDETERVTRLGEDINPGHIESGAMITDSGAASTATEIKQLGA
jgi:hypothetical protein